MLLVVEANGAEYLLASGVCCNANRAVKLWRGTIRLLYRLSGRRHNVISYLVRKRKRAARLAEEEGESESESCAPTVIEVSSSD